MTQEKDRPDQDWRRTLTPTQYEVLRRKGTERPFTGEYWDHHEQGTYACAGCGAELFASLDKFDSGTGWPSFTCPVQGGPVAEAEDTTHGMRRTEVVCSGCGGHLGHVFDDGPPPTHKRFCINSASLTFRPRT
jgi:peptide-methionine (R)-S-oxide reductase